MTEEDKSVALMSLEEQLGKMENTKQQTEQQQNKQEENYGI
jgi:hypothetical protein